MEIQAEYFWEWCIQFFGEDNVIKRGQEICINSPFTTEPDKGHHLQCNTYKNAYHCFKSDAHGHLYHLVQEMEQCTYPEAMEILGGDRQLHLYAKKIEQYFAEKQQRKFVSVLEKKRNLLALPQDTVLISNMTNPKAREYIERRCLPCDGLYYCFSGRYRDRIIIPYYNPERHLIYYNARDITEKAADRYRGPHASVGVGKSDVLWVKQWPKPGSTLYLTEGEFDAMSLWEAEFCGAACGGKNFSFRQLKLVEQYHITICFDLDTYGIEAMNKVGTELRKKSGFIRDIGFVKPAKGFKDWNDMLIKIGKNALNYYIKTNEHTLNQWSEMVKLQWERYEKPHPKKE